MPKRHLALLPTEEPRECSSTSWRSRFDMFLYRGKSKRKLKVVEAAVEQPSATESLATPTAAAVSDSATVLSRATESPNDSRSSEDGVHFPAEPTASSTLARAQQLPTTMPSTATIDDADELPTSASASGPAFFPASMPAPMPAAASMSTPAPGPAPSPRLFRPQHTGERFETPQSGDASYQLVSALHNRGKKCLHGPSWHRPSPSTDEHLVDIAVPSRTGKLAAAGGDPAAPAFGR